MNKREIQLYLFSLLNLYTFFSLITKTINYNISFLTQKVTYVHFPLIVVLMDIILILFLFNAIGYLLKLKLSIILTYLQIMITIYMFIPTAYFFLHLSKLFDVKYYMYFRLLTIIFELYKLIFFIMPSNRKLFVKSLKKTS